MKKTIKIIALTLAVIITVLTVASCSSYGENIMTLGDKGISVNAYQLLLSRMKGTLYTYGYDVESTIVQFPVANENPEETEEAAEAAEAEETEALEDAA